MHPQSLSVIVPAHRAARTLPACLQAIRASLAQPDELIVVADGGEDEETTRIARSYDARVVSLPDRVGPGGARNAGVAGARGDVLVFVDADVCVQPEAIGALANALAQNPRIDAVFGSYDSSPARPNLVSQYRNLLHHYVHQRGKEEAQTFWAGLGAIRREAFEAVRGFDAERYPRPSIEDIELGDRLRRSGRGMQLVKTAQGKHLKHWSFFGMLTTDIFRRGLPWTELIVSTGHMPDDLNLGLRHRVGVGATGLGLAALCGAIFEPRLLLVSALAFAVAVAAAGDILLFFTRERGPLFAARAAPLHLVYFAAAGFAFFLGSSGVSGIVDRGRIWRSTFSLGFGEIASRAFSFIATVHVARVLGAGNFGRVEFASAIVLYASAFATFGLDVVGTVRVAASPSDARMLARTIVGLRLRLTTAACLVLMGLTFLVPRLAEIRLLLLLTFLVVWIEAARVNWAFQGLERMKRVAAAGILGQAIYAAGVFAFVRESGGLLRVPVLSAAGSAVTTAILAVIAWKSFSALPRLPHAGLTRSLLREAAPLAANAAASLVVYNADVVLLGFIQDERHVGLYRAATRIVGVFTMLGASYSAAVFPSIARAVGNRDRFVRTLNWTIRTGAAVWVVATAILVVAAPTLLRLTFGQTYRESIITLRLLILSAAVVGVRAQFRQALVALKKAHRNLPPTLWAAVTNVTLNLLLIRRYGMRGAGIATIVSETVMLFFVWREVDRAVAKVPR